MNTKLLQSQILSSLLAGTTRQPLVGVPGPSPELKALSLAGQALRFERPAAPPHFTVEPEIGDNRKILPDALRRPILRLLTGKLGTEHAALAIAYAFDRLRLRPHPFDLPRLENFVRNHAGQLGPTAQHWAHSKSEAASESTSYFDDELLSDENWMHASLGQKAQYFEQRRAQNPSAARELLEAAWGQFDPDARVRLLHAMDRTLEAADQPFLESLEKDRAPRVRALAQRFIARLGGGGDNPAARELLTRIKQTQEGLIRKRRVLSLEIPATVKLQGEPMWIREVFVDVTLDELCRMLVTSETDLLHAAAKDARLLLGLCLMATDDRRLDFFAKVVDDHLPNAWELLEQSGLRELPLMSTGERLEWASMLANPYGRKPPASYPQWNWLHRILRQPIPAQLMEVILKSNWLDELPNLDVEKQGAAWMELIVAVCPPSQMNLLRTRLAGFDTAITSTALPLIDILDAMENVRAHA